MAEAEQVVSSQLEPLQKSKQAVWELKSKEIEGIKDRLGKGIDDGIKETVVALHVLGINTTQSCEGHKEWGTGSPWVDIEAADVGVQEEQMHQAFDTARSVAGQEGINHITQEDIEQLFSKAHTLRREVRQRNMREVAKTMGYLEEFYRNRDIPYDRRLILNSLTTSGTTRIESQGGIFQETAPAEIKQKKLAEYQEEMQAFTTFLKEKYNQVSDTAFCLYLPRCAVPDTW